MIATYSSTRWENTTSGVRYYSTDATSYSACDSTASPEYYDDTVYYVASTGFDSYEALLESVKLNKVYPWELESPILKFVKPVMVDEPPVFDRKLFINAYKSARSTIAKN